MHPATPSLTQGPAAVAARVPGLSVVVPTRDRPHALVECLDSLARAEAPPNGLEVVVVDDAASPDPAVRAVIERFGSSPLAVRCIAGGGRGPAAARNRGARLARAARVAFTDDDCRVHPSWVLEHFTASRRSPRALLGGRIENAFPDAAAARAHQSLLETLDRWYLEHRRPLFCSNNLSVDRRLFLDLGGFDPRFARAAGEDFDLCDRWRDRAPVEAVPGAVVTHQHPATIGALLRRHRLYGRGSDQFRRHARVRASAAGGLESPRLYARLLTAPIRERGIGGLFEALLLCGTQAATAWGRIEARFAPDAPPLPRDAESDP